MMSIKEFTIGQLAKIAQTKVQTIRYYEQKNLLEEPIRTMSGHRRYYQKTLDRLMFIRHGREMGFSLNDIKELLSLSNEENSSCEQVDAIASQHLARVNSRMRRLKSLQKELKRMIGTCQKGVIGNCRIIEVLQDHKHCGDDHGEIEKI